MPRSSDSIGALAAALAKAQGELINPEKTLTATLPAAGPAAGEPRSFRYASLASGLEIVRQCLGRHEIAVMQTTALDEAAASVRLTTMLVHASGEWIASDWPVCPVSEMTSPQRMGAALTYARRYGLFTLVGIAGEDDLDAPDLNSGASAVFPGPRNGQNGKGNGFVQTGAAGAAPPTFVNGGNGRRPTATHRPLLPDAPSALERDRLLAELAGLTGNEAHSSWAQAVLPIKNTLQVDHARAVEAAFAARLAGFENGEPLSGLEVPRPDAENGAALNAKSAPASGAAQKLSPACAAASPRAPRRRRASSPPAAATIDKSTLAFPEPRRLRDREHLKVVARQPCLVCGRTPSDPHHLRFAQPRALGRKVSDESTVLLCRTHHREIHRIGDEAAWWSDRRLEPLVIAATLWRRTHPLPGTTPDGTKPIATTGPA
jgi:hypothetical protein